MEFIISKEQKTMKVLLDALMFYKDINRGLDYDTIEIIDEQIGALRANLYGEENGWRSKEEQVDYEDRRSKQIAQLFQYLINMAKVDNNDSKWEND